MILAGILVGKNMLGTDLKVRKQTLPLLLAIIEEYGNPRRQKIDWQQLESG